MLCAAWGQYAKNYQLILTITLIVYIPINTALFFIPVEDTADGIRLYLRAIQLLESFFGIISTLAIANAIKCSMEGKPIRTADALKKSLSRWGAAIWTNVVVGFFLLGLTLLLIVPGVIYAVLWGFATYVVALTDKSGKAALDYSKGIVRGRWWTVLGYALVFGLLSLCAGITAAVPYWFLPEGFLSSLATDTLIDVVSSFFIVVSTVFYLNFDATKTA